MKRFCQVAVVIMASWLGAHAQSCPVTAGMTQAQIQSVVNGCAVGGTVTVAAGTYSVTDLTPKCGVNIEGPNPGTFTYQMRGENKEPIYATTAIFSSPTRTAPILKWSNCTTAMQFSGIQFRNAPAFYATGPINNFTFIENACYNLPGGAGGNGSGSCGYFQLGNNTNPLGPNVFIEWNDIGDANSCLTPTNVLMKAQVDQGGLCNGFMEQGQINGLTIMNNSFYHLENGINKVVCDGSSSGCEPSNGASSMNNVVIRYNGMSQIHRAQIEEQPQPSTGNDNEFNTLQHILNSNKLSIGVSMPCCDTGATSPGQVSSNNTFTNSEAPNSGDYVAFSFEFWGLGSAGSHNLVQGYYAVGFSWGYGNSPWAMNYNTLQLVGVSGGNTNANGNSCVTGTNATPTGSALNNGFINNEECAQAGLTLPTATNNVESTTVTQQTSFAPTITPASGAQTFPLTVTIVDAGYGSTSSLPNGNTSIWYTTDGSTPGPATGTSTLCNPTGAVSCTVTMTAAGTINAIGMWGTGADTLVWVAPYGWKQSSTVSAAYTGGGTPTAATPVLTPASEGFTGTLSVSAASTTSGATLYCTTDGSTPTTSSPVYSAPFSVTATETINCIAAATGYLNSAVGTGTYTLGTPTLTGGHQANTGSVNQITVGAAGIQQTAVGTYSDGVSRNLPDAFGNTAVWSSSNTAELAVSSSGVITGVAAGSAQSKVKSSPGNVTFSPWTWTVNPTAPPTLQSVSLATTGGVSAIGYQQTNQILATCTYSDGSTTSCNTADSHGNAVTTWTSSATAYVTISSSGLATGAAIGSSNLTAVANGITSSPLVLSVTSTATLVSAYLSPTSGSCVPAGTIQFAAYCHYTTGADQSCTVTDMYGDAVTAWSSATPADVTVANVGATSPGLASCVAAGSSAITATINASVSSTPATVTVTNPVTLTGITLATAGGVTGLFVGSTNQLKATCTYSDGSTTNCTTTDAHGNVAGTWTSTTPSHASVNASSGLATGVAAGNTTFTAKAGSFTSPAIPLTVLAVPTGVYTITISGPVRFSGTVSF